MSQQLQHHAMFINFDKTELIWFGTCSMLPKLQGLETGIRVGGVEVKPVRDLGVILDCKLNMQAHYQQGCIGRLLSSPQNSTTSTLSRQGRSTKTRVGYCVIEDRLLQRRTRRIFLRLHWLFSSESSTPLLASSPTSDHVSHVLRDLHRLPIHERISYKVSRDVQHRQRYSANIYDWHGHAYLRSSRSVSSPFCREGTV